MTMLDEQIPRPASQSATGSATGYSRTCLANRARPCRRRGRHQAADPNQRECCQRNAPPAGVARARLRLMEFRVISCTRGIRPFADASGRTHPQLVMRRHERAAIGGRWIHLRVVVGIDFRRAVFVRAVVDDRLLSKLPCGGGLGASIPACSRPTGCGRLRPEEQAVDEVDDEDDLRSAQARRRRCVMNWFIGCKCWNVS